MASTLRIDLLNSLADAALETAIASVATNYRSQWTAGDGTQKATADVQNYLQFRKEIMNVMTKRLLRKGKRNKTYGLADAGLL
jgi:hypothetical protein